MRFRIYGHENVRALHKNTIEFTKDDFLSVNGDCIVGIKAEFDPVKLKEFVKNHKFCKISLRVGAWEDIMYAKTNSDFEDAHELVIRLGEFPS